MKYFSTNNRHQLTGFAQALVQGLPDDNGLFFPESIPLTLENSFESLSLAELGAHMLSPFVESDIDRSSLERICSEALSFPIPVVEVEPGISALELFHGPTLAFKDVGARFLARMIRQVTDEKLTVLVATSGDTGSAVANGFYGVEGIDVVILYPSGKISDIQEKQLTTMGGNVRAIEVEGVFDDCQRLVKQAFLDDSLRQKINLTSANSINIMRWIPQSIYYAWAIGQMQSDNSITISVPSGNFGNLAAGVLAMKMGAPIGRFIAATNANHIVPDYIETGVYTPASSVATISNAMDVGDPSNFPRLLELFDNDHYQLKEKLHGYWQNDEKTLSTIRACSAYNHYTLDPHGAIAYQAIVEKRDPAEEYLFLETAHPSKFKDVIDEALGSDIAIPGRLADCLSKTKEATLMPADYDQFVDYLCS